MCHTLDKVMQKMVRVCLQQNTNKPRSKICNFYVLSRNNEWKRTIFIRSLIILLDNAKSERLSPKTSSEVTRKSFTMFRINEVL